MFKTKAKLVLIILMLITLVLSPLCFADDEEQNIDNAELLSEEESIQEQAIELIQNDQHQPEIKSGDQYLIGDSVVVDSVIDGNLYVIGNDVTVKSQVIGNVFVMANKVTIDNQGYITGSLYALGNDIEITGVVYDVYTSANNTTISGYVYRDVRSVSNNFSIYGTIGRDAYITANNIAFSKENDNESSNGAIMGNLDYTANSELNLPENTVNGKVTFNQYKESTTSPIYYVILACSSIIFVLAIWGLFKWLSPKFIDNCDKLVTAKTLKTVGFGLLGLIVLPIIAVLLLIAGITASVGLLLLFTYFILVFISHAVSIIAINNIIAKKLKFETTLKTFLLLIATSLVVLLVTFIPIVGGLINLVITILGMGIVLVSLISKNKNLDEAK